MISTRLLTAKGVQHGGKELIEVWRQDKQSILWLDIQQMPTDEEARLLASFDCHQLAITDAQRDRHPPKLEIFADQTFLLFRGVAEINQELDITHVQIALFAGERFLISRHQQKSYSIEHWLNSAELAEHLKNPFLLSLQILHYSSGLYLEKLFEFESNLVDLEDQMHDSANDELLKDLILYKTRLRKLKRTLDYHQRVAQTLLQHPPTHFKQYDKTLTHYIQDFYERCERVHGLANMYYEICGDLIEGYLSLSSHQLNLTMRVLTVITAVFVPLGFIAGLYGMNFEYMPELSYRYSYFIILGVMLATSLSLLFVFYKKRWIGKRSD